MRLKDLVKDRVRRVIRKQPCKACPCMTYWNGHAFLCVGCDHEMFEPCLDCQSMLGWCQCAGDVEQPEPLPRLGRTATVRSYLEAHYKLEEPFKVRDVAHALSEQLTYNQVSNSIRCMRERGEIIRFGIYKNGYYVRNSDFELLH